MVLVYCLCWFENIKCNRPDIMKNAKTWEPNRSAKNKISRKDIQYMLSFSGWKEHTESNNVCVLLIHIDVLIYVYFINLFSSCMRWNQ